MAKEKFTKRILCIGAGYVGGPTMAMIAAKCPQFLNFWDFTAQILIFLNMIDASRLHPNFGLLSNFRKRARPTVLLFLLGFLSFFLLFSRSDLGLIFFLFLLLLVHVLITLDSFLVAHVFIFWNTYRWHNWCFLRILGRWWVFDSVFEVAVEVDWGVI